MPASSRFKLKRKEKKEKEKSTTSPEFSSQIYYLKIDILLK